MTRYRCRHHSYPLNYLLSISLGGFACFFVASVALPLAAYTALAGLVLWAVPAMRPAGRVTLRQAGRLLGWIPATWKACGN